MGGETIDSVETDIGSGFIMDDFVMELQVETNKERYWFMNIYELPPLPLTEEVTTILTENENIRIERIISAEQLYDWYDQDETEFVILLDGNAVIEYENGTSVSLYNS